MTPVATWALILAVASMPAAALAVMSLWGRFLEKRLVPTRRDVFATMTALPATGILMAVKFSLCEGWGARILSLLALSVCLWLHAYADKKTCEVYSHISWIMDIAGIAFIIACVGGGVWALFDTLPAVAFLILLAAVARLIHLYGDGDGGAFFGMGLILIGAFGSYGMWCLIMCYCVSLIIVTLSHRKMIDKKVKKFKEPVPFMPSAFVGTMLVLIVFA